MTTTSREENLMRAAPRTLRWVIRTTALAIVVGAFAVPVAQARVYADDGAGATSTATAVATPVTDGLGREVQPVTAPETAPVTDALGREVQPVTVTDGLGREVEPVRLAPAPSDDTFWSTGLTALAIGLGLLLVAGAGIAFVRRGRPQPAA
jgi:hypothetical protein